MLIILKCECHLCLLFDHEMLKRQKINCELCLETFSSNASLLKHKQLIHLVVASERYMCYLCTREFDFKSCFIEPAKTTHGKNFEVECKCHSCRRVLQRRKQGAKRWLWTFSGFFQKWVQVIIQAHPIEDLFRLLSRAKLPKMPSLARPILFWALKANDSSFYSALVNIKLKSKSIQTSQVWFLNLRLTYFS